VLRLYRSSEFRSRWWLSCHSHSPVVALWEAQRRIDDFLLGEHDTPDWLLIPEKPYGRQREVETCRPPGCRGGGAWRGFRWEVAAMKQCQA
jgi:hypothetical protein